MSNLPPGSADKRNREKRETGREREEMREKGKKEEIEEESKRETEADITE